jgi:REP element-mobilizing transposase RayT
MKDTGDNELPPIAERRPFVRKRVLLGGVAVHSLRRNGVNCQIRDIADTGARISVPHAVNLPDHLHLIIVRERVAYEARVIWRKGEESGLSFCKAIDLRGSNDPSLSHLVRILTEQQGNYLSWR